MALMLYDLCNFLYFECWGKILFPDDVYAYSVEDDIPMTLFPRRTSRGSQAEMEFDEPTRTRLPKSVINSEEEVVWKRPRFEIGSPIDYSSESFDDFIEIFND